MQNIDEIYFEDFHETDVICIYSKCKDEHIAFLRNYLKDVDNRKVVFLEDDYNRYEDLKNFVDKNFASEKEKTKTVFIKDFENDLKKIAWKNVYLDLKIIKGSNETKNNSFEKISKTLTEFHLGANLTSYLYSDFGIKNFENLYNNLINRNEFRLFESLKNEFKNIPAIIAGAGPSLDKNLYLLKDLHNKALIFTGGSALNIFAKKNINFHFAASVDPNPFFKRFKENEIFEKPFYYQNQIHHRNLSLVHSNKILVSDYGAHPLEKWIYERLNIQQETFEAGWTITTFLIKIAKILGCNPIITVGLDLSYKNQKYSKGVVKEKNTYSLIKVKDIYGNDVVTQKDWLLSKSWIEEYAALNKDVTFINATEGGLEIENLKNLKLLDVLNNLKNTQIDLDGYIHTKILNENFIKLDKKQVIDILSKILNSLKKSDEICDNYLAEIEKDNIDFNLLKLQKEFTYVYLLDPLWQIWKYTIERNVENNEIHILINKLIFFKNVIFEHFNLLRKFL